MTASTTDRLVSLAAGTVLDLDPAATVDVTATAGFGATGIWFDPETWTAATTTAVSNRLRSTGITPLDIEPVILGRAHDPGNAVIDVAAELGARHVLVASGPADRAAVVQRFGELCERAAPAGTVVVLEFLPIFTVGTLGDAVAIVEEVGQPNGAVLVDTLHLARSGGSPDELRGVTPLLPYIQVADAPVGPPAGDRVSLRDEALHGRLLPGDGALPLEATLAAVPGVPLSLELRSAQLMTRFPDPLERARAVLAAADALIARSHA